MTIDARDMDFQQLNGIVRDSEGDVTLEGVCGQRFIAAGLSGRSVVIRGIPGNALGAYLNGAEVTVYGNAQDATGDTMNAGRIVIHGSIGDAAGYAMRGGEIYVRGNAGYRAGIHMKEYRDKRPVMVIGGSCGSFLGEYQAGGFIIVLNLDGDGPAAGTFPCTGMHGGRVYLRCTGAPVPALPKGVTAETVEGAPEEIRPYLQRFAEAFGADAAQLMQAAYVRIVPDSRNPYKQMYVTN